jgi:DNA replication protein DnaD
MPKDIIQSKYSQKQTHHPDVDIDRLTQSQQAEIKYMKNRIDNLYREYKGAQMDVNGAINNHFEKLRKNVELEEFFNDCVNVCEKEILRSHVRDFLIYRN